MSSTKKWAITFVPLIVYVLGFFYSLATGQDFSPQQAELLQGLLLAFIGSAGTGGAVAIAHAIKGT